MPAVAQISTKADPAVAGWAIHDIVGRLRIYATEEVFPLSPGDSFLVGASAEAAIRLQDSSGRVSRRHALIERRGDEWLITDLDSTNGLRQDGESRKTFVLTPGTEVDIGGVKLVAESEGLLELRELLCRLIGWSAERARDVDRALRAIRDMAHLRTCLVLCGDGKLEHVARLMHAKALGAACPFSTREDAESGIDALARAVDGTLFLDGKHLPDDLQHVLVSLRLPDTRARLIVGANEADVAAQLTALIPTITTLQLPRLADRTLELDRLLEAFAVDAVVQLGATETGLRPHDLKWIKESGIATLDDAAEVMLRVVAMRNWGVTEGAERLGITHGALSRWARRRKLPT